jgi:hypothetical protein
MTSSDEHSREATTDPSDGSHVAANLWRLLAAAQRAGGDPLSDLASSLALPESADILVRDTFTARDAPLAGFGDARAHLEQGAGIELLRAMKARAKRDLGPEQHDPARRRAAMLAFGLVVSATLTQHGVLDTRASRESVEDLLLALCSAEVGWIATLAAKALTALARVDS